MANDQTTLHLSVEKRPHHGSVVIYDWGGQRAASFAEIVMWLEIERLRARVEELEHPDA